MLRHLRSYVRREGRMTSGQKKALEKLWGKYGLELSPTPYVFAQLFSRHAPLVIEIGFGMGHALLELAAANPEKDYLGIEVYRPGVGTLLAALEQRGLTNVRVVNADAVEVLQRCVADESVSEIFILFPDPWPKKRHQKRRLVQIDFIKLLEKKLQPGGFLHLATDWQDYAEHMQQVMAYAPGFKQLPAKKRPITKFEQRGKRLGHQIWSFVYMKA